MFPKGFNPLLDKIEKIMKRNKRKNQHVCNKLISPRHSSDTRRPETAPAAYKQIRANFQADNGVKKDELKKRDILAAAVMWERTSRPATAVRQCLTYAEIVRNKEEMC